MVHERDHEQHENAVVDEGMDSEEEGLQLLLAGLSSDQMANVPWPDDSSSEEQTMVSGLACRRKPQTAMKAPRVDLDACSSTHLDSGTMVNAHSWDESGLLIQPLVRIVEFGSKGNGLVVTQPFKKGSTIFTERALYSNSSHQPACCNCWRSLSEPSDVADNLPDTHVWPTTVNKVQSHECGSLFCSPHCQAQHDKLFGSCCRLRKCLGVVPKSEEAVGILQLGIVVFVAAVHGHRTADSADKLGPIMDNLCGSSIDVGPLELDESLDSIYMDLVRILELTIEEQAILSRTRFATYVAIVARNSFEGHTKSPFDSYFACLNRSSRSKVAMVLGGGTLTRQINRSIQDKVVVPVAAIFGLTARINHSCDPNVEAMSQNYMDCHMDIVARRDLEAGEELLISYLPDIKSTARRRRMLLAKYLFWCECSRCTEGRDAS
ncbi:SET domain-containing protein [Fragilaria crotonensis]|nr:SET domain-containing protein [Fragilaria crotonensis]